MATAEELAEFIREYRFRRKPECYARVFHGPGHQSGTHCQVSADDPHTVHAATYGSYSQWGVWVDHAVNPKYPWIEAGDAFDVDDDDEELVRRFEAEDRERAAKHRLNQAKAILEFISGGSAND